MRSVDLGLAELLSLSFSLSVWVKDKTVFKKTISKQEQDYVWHAKDGFAV